MKQLEAVVANVNDLQDGKMRQVCVGETIAFYLKGNQVMAAATSQRDTETAAISELMRLNQMPTAEALRKGSFDLVGQLRPSNR